MQKTVQLIIIWKSEIKGRKGRLFSGFKLIKENVNMKRHWVLASHIFNALRHSFLNSLDGEDIQVQKEKCQPIWITAWD